MVELLAKSKTNIDLYSNEEFQDMKIRNFSVHTNTEGMAVIRHTAADVDAVDTMKVLNKVLKNTKYRVSFRVDKFNANGTDEKLKVGFNGQSVEADANGYFSGIVLSDNNEDFQVSTKRKVSCDVYDIEIESLFFSQLDLYKPKEVLMTKSRKSFINPDQLSGDYTKTFTLPSTNANDFFFTDIHKLDSITRFNVNKSSEAIIRSEGLDVMKGKILLDETNNESGDRTYKVQFLGSNTTFLNNLVGKSLRDLALDQTTDNQVSLADLKKSWAFADGKSAQAAGRDFVFTLGDYGQDYDHSYLDSDHTLYPTDSNLVQGVDDLSVYHGLSMKEFKPSFFANYFMDRIHNEAGYTYSGSVFGTDEFKSIIVPINSSFTKEELTLHTFRLKGSSVGFSFSVAPSFLPWSPISGTTTIAESAENGRTLRILGNLLKSGPIKDSSFYIPKDSLVSNLTATIKVSGKMYAGDATDPSSVGTKGKVQLQLLRRLNFSSGAHGTKVYLLHSEAMETDDNGIYSFDFNVDLPASYFYSANSNDGTNFDFLTDFLVNVKGAAEVGLDKSPELHVNGVEWDVLNTVNQISKELQPGSFIEDASQFYSSTVKQVDFVKSLVTMFNLFMEEDVPNKHINYTTFDDSFSKVPKNFTRKLDNFSDVRKKFIKLEDVNAYEFSFEEGKTLRSVNYKKEMDSVYGSSIFNQDNDNSNIKQIRPKANTTTEKTISTPYTTSDGDSRLNYASLLKKTEGEEDVEFRPDYDTGLHFLFYRSVDNIRTKVHDELGGTLSELHFPVMTETLKKSGQPDNFAINFGDISNLTDLLLEEPKRNFVNTFWSRYISLILNKDNYFMEADYRLTSKDFFELRMSDLIEVENQHYFLQEVKDFNPERLTTITLLRANFGQDILNKVASGDFFRVEKIGAVDIGGTKGRKSRRTIASTRTNIGKKTSGISTDSIDNVFVGDGSRNVKVLLSSDVSLFGSNSNINVYGCENVQIADGVHDVTLINTDNKFIRQSNTTWVNGFKLGNDLVDEKVINDGGVDTVQQAFSDAGIEDGCENEMWKLDWKLTWQVMDGGDDSKF